MSLEICGCSLVRFWHDNVPVCAGHVGKPRRSLRGVMLERHAWRRGYSLYKTPSTQAGRHRVAGGFARASGIIRIKRLKKVIADVINNLPRGFPVP